MFLQQAGLGWIAITYNKQRLIFNALFIQGIYLIYVVADNATRFTRHSVDIIFITHVFSTLFINESDWFSYQLTLWTKRDRLKLTCIKFPSVAEKSTC